MLTVVEAFWMDEITKRERIYIEKRVGNRL